MTNALNEVVNLEPEQMRAYLLTHPLSRGGRLWCDRLIEGVDQGRRDCIRLFGEAMKWVGGHQNLMLVLVQQLGVRDQSELEKLVHSGRKLEQLQQDASASHEDFRDEAVELLLMLFRSHPEWRAQAVKRLSSEALEAEGNGRP
jgi:hypothetical protein